MQGVISERLLNKLKPAEAPYEVRDTRMTGFLVRVQPSGLMTFYVEYARGKRYKLGRTDAVKPEAAREAAKGILADAHLGKDPMEAKRAAKAHTFAEFVDEVYAPWAEQNVKSHRNTLTRLRANFPDLSKKKLGEITAWLVEKWRSARLKGGARPSTVNRDLDDLRSVLAKAVKWGHLQANPVVDVKRSRVDDSASIRFLSEDEIGALVKALDEREERIRAERDNANAWRRERGYALLPDLRETAFADYLKPMVLVSLHTGMRQGEVFQLKWSAVDFTRAIVTVRGETAKSSRTRHIPLNNTARLALSDWRKQAPDPDGLVFPGKAGEVFNNVRKSWTAVLDGAEIKAFRWHDLRHTFASRLVMAGVDLNTVRELLGHSTIAMTLRYSHLAPEHKAAAVAKLEAAL
ncbi:site-specific integrase [Thalassobaculum sp.]|uniref:site-specific integrase n=1 Tax=Thalassobaculum sp. TaxID=2022740 RepID=UPI0032EED1AF